MDLSKIITGLRAERDRLGTVIAHLEALAGLGDGTAQHPRARSRRGRKSMGEAERQLVSERMRKYWASQREARGAPTATDISASI